MAKTVTLRLEDEVYEVLRGHSEAEKRPLSNYIEMAALEYTCVQQFVDDEEMTAILSNQELLKRIQKGSRDAKNRKGRFVA